MHVIKRGINWKTALSIATIFGVHLWLVHRWYLACRNSSFDSFVLSCPCLFGACVSDFSPAAIATAAAGTVKNCKTGDLSLIIRFTFYAFQMINANAGICYERSIAKNATKFVMWTFELQRTNGLALALAPRVHIYWRPYNFCFIYIHH